MNCNSLRMFSYQLDQQHQNVIVFGQVISCTQMNPQNYCISITDNFDNIEFWWQSDLSLGAYVEVQGNYSTKIYNSIKIHKIYAKRIKILESSNDYMVCFLETMLEQKLLESPSKDVEKLFLEKQTITNPSMELTTRIVTYSLKLLANRYLLGFEQSNQIELDLKHEEFEDLIYSQEEIQLSLQILNRVGLMKGNHIFHQEIYNLIEFVRKLLISGQELSLKDCTEKINQNYQFRGCVMFTEDISVCLFNIFLLNYICVQNNKTTIIIK